MRLTDNQMMVEIVTILTGGIVNMSTIWAMVYLRVHKPKSERYTVKSSREFLGKYWPEILMTIVLVPQWHLILNAVIKIIAS